MSQASLMKEDALRAVLFGTIAALSLAGAAVAQSNPQTTTESPAATAAAPAAPAADTMSRSGTTGMSDRDANGAVNTSKTEAMVPAHGANSFTRGEARARIAKHGYSDVKLARKKDANGVWRGTAMHDGQQVSVWLDYKGNVGQQ